MSRTKHLRPSIELGAHHELKHVCPVKSGFESLNFAGSSRRKFLTSLSRAVSPVPLHWPVGSGTGEGSSRRVMVAEDIAFPGELQC